MTAFVQATRFASVGVLSTLVHVTVSVWLIAGLGQSPVFANATAFVVATLIAYTLNTLWSFSARLETASLVRYVSVSLVGFFSTIAISALAQALSLHYGVGIALVVLLVPVISFVLHRVWTYRQ